MNKAYWGWYKCIEDDSKDKAVGVGAKVGIEIKVWGT